MTHQLLLQRARAILGSPVYLCVYDDEGDVCAELRSIHGGRLHTVTAASLEHAVIALEKLIRPAPPQTSEGTERLLRRSLVAIGELPERRGR
jgi:hypothetical protein